MSEYEVDLENSIKEFETQLPGKLKGEINTRSDVIEKETWRSKYLFGILESSLDLLNNPTEQRIKNILVSNMSQVLQHYTEGGGAGSEAFTRLMALGVIDNMPNISISNDIELVSTKDAVITIDSENDKISLSIKFNACAPDGNGQETWRNRIDGGNVCSADITLKLTNKEPILEFLSKLHNNYEELMAIKYPEHR